VRMYTIHSWHMMEGAPTLLWHARGEKPHQVILPGGELTYSTVGWSRGNTAVKEAYADCYIELDANTLFCPLPDCPAKSRQVKVSTGSSSWNFYNFQLHLGQHHPYVLANEDLGWKTLRAAAAPAAAAAAEPAQGGGLRTLFGVTQSDKAKIAQKILTYMVGCVLHGRTGNFSSCEDPAIREMMREILDVPATILDEEMCVQPPH